MKHYLVSLALIALVGGLSGCVKITDKDKDESTPVDHYVEAMETPNQFRVHLTVVQGAADIRRQDLTKQEINAAAVKLEKMENSLVDSNVIPGEKYRYQYFSAGGDVLKIVEVAIPLDLVIDRSIELTSSPQWQNIYRVYFTKSGVLTTNGNNVLLKAQMIYSDHGVIQTFPEGKTADTEVNGRSGGQIRIFAQAATGDLSVQLRGENGGAGDPSAGLKKGDGGDGGDSGKFYYDSPSTALHITFTAVPGQGGAGAAALPALSICPMGNCQHQGEALGIPGRKAGQRGIDGLRGEACFAQSGRLLSCDQ